LSGQRALHVLRCQDFSTFVEWTLARNVTTVCSQEDLASSTPNPEPSPPSPRGAEPSGSTMAPSFLLSTMARQCIGSARLPRPYSSVL
ncbi:hypothetical protein M9458_028806, partial [Cirrhinus mrigala]